MRILLLHRILSISFISRLFIRILSDEKEKNNINLNFISILNFRLNEEARDIKPASVRPPCRAQRD